MCQTVMSDSVKDAYRQCKYSRWIKQVERISHQCHCNNARCAGKECPNYGRFRESINQLVKEAQKGNRESTEKLIEYYKNYVFQMEKRYFIPGGDREDLFQEGFIGLYQAIKNYRSDSPLTFEDYVSLSIRNSVIRAVRSATQKKQMVLTNAKSIFDKSVIDISARKFCPEELTFRTIAAEKVSSIVKSHLSRRESQMLSLKMQGYSADEIANNFNTDKKTVDNALYRARNKIKRHMATRTAVHSRKPLNLIKFGKGENQLKVMAL